MQVKVDYKDARDLLVSMAKEVELESMDLDECAREGRILGEDLVAAFNVPAFDRSPYDGYAFRAEDTEDASRELPVTLKIIEEIAAGSVASMPVTEGTAVKILTGAPIPAGADTVIMYEKTQFTDEAVTIFGPCKKGDNIVRTGEDVKKGELLAAAGTVIDAGLAGTIAAQGKERPKVYKKVRAALISTGSELVNPGDGNPSDGKIYNSNRYSLAAALSKDGVSCTYLGTAGDNVQEIERLIRQGLSEYDIVLLTGGVSAGDYDLTPDAMEKAGCELLIKGVNIKPGMACCFGVKEGKPVYALSGNPSSSLINYLAVVRPAVRKITGLKEYMPEEFKVALGSEFRKTSKMTRFLKGKLRIVDGRAVMEVPKGQGNVSMGSSVGCDLMAIVPKGEGPIPQGGELTAFMV